MFSLAPALYVVVVSVVVSGWKTATISHSTSIVIQTCTQLAVSRQNTITVQRTGYSTLNAGECTPFLVPCIVAGLVCNSLIYLFLYVS